MKRFPFILLFRIIEESNIVALESIFHSAQDPNKYPAWKNPSKPPDILIDKSQVYYHSNEAVRVE